MSSPVAALIPLLKTNPSSQTASQVAQVCSMHMVHPANLGCKVVPVAWPLTGRVARDSMGTGPIHIETVVWASFLATSCAGCTVSAVSERYPAQGLAVLLLPARCHPASPRVSALPAPSLSPLSPICRRPRCWRMLRCSTAPRTTSCPPATPPAAPLGSCSMRWCVAPARVWPACGRVCGPGGCSGTAPGSAGREGVASLRCQEERSMRWPWGWGKKPGRGRRDASGVGTGRCSGSGSGSTPIPTPTSRHTAKPVGYCRLRTRTRARRAIVPGRCATHTRGTAIWPWVGVPTAGAFGRHVPWARAQPPPLCPRCILGMGTTVECYSVVKA